MKYVHGQSRTKENGIWRQMRARCNNPNDPAYANYGGRGIRVCARWDSFVAFMEDMGPRPPRYQIDRRDNEGDYEPSNCRWVSQKENLNNKRTSRKVEWRGEVLTVTAWSEKLGIHPRTLHNRLTRGWSVEDAMTTATV